MKGSAQCSLCGSGAVVEHMCSECGRMALEYSEDQAAHIAELEGVLGTFLSYDWDTLASNSGGTLGADWDEWLEQARNLLEVSE